MKITIKAENQIESTKVTHDWFHWSCFSVLYKGYLFAYLMLTYEFNVILKLFRMGVSGLLTDGEEKGNKFLTCKMSLISYNEELCTVTLKRKKKKYESHDATLESFWHQHFFNRNQQLLIYQKIQIQIAL